METTTKKKLSSAGELNDYIRVTSPSVWFILLAMVVFAAGLIVWGFGGSLTTSVSAAATVRDGVITFYIRDFDAAKVKAGMEANVAGTTSLIQNVSVESSPAADVMNDYTRSLIGVTPQAHVYISEGVTSLPDGSYNASIVVEDLHPVALLFGGR